MKRVRLLLATLALGLCSVMPVVTADWAAKVKAPISFDSPTTAWASYIQSPASRDISPVAIHGTWGSVATAATASARGGCMDASVATSLEATLTGNGSYVTYDFGKQVSGFVTIHFGASTTAHARLGVAFSESEEFIGVVSDNSTDMSIVDGTIYADANPSTSFTFSREFARGSYRYLTLSIAAEDALSTVEVTAVSTHFTAAPHTPADALREYTGYFHSDDDLLNRIWYAGVYTVQLCHIFANESRANPPAITTSGWFNNATIAGLGADGEAFVDGAKRDRTPWPGDFGASVLPKLVALNRDNLDSVGNSIASLYKLQTKGLFPYAGSPIGERVVAANVNSDTYHLWTMIALAEYTVLSGNTMSMKALWTQTVLGMKTSLDKVDPSDSLMEVTAPFDWGRTGQGGKNIAANLLLYRALVACSEVAAELGLQGASYNGSSWTMIAESLKTAVNTNLWDASAGLYRDNLTTTMHPQDGNVLAVRFNVTQTSEQAVQVSTGVMQNWNRFGSVAQEAFGAISPFITGSEITTHFIAYPGDATRAMEILRRQWGYMLQRFSNSTLIEGFADTGELEFPPYGIGMGAYVSHAHAWSAGPVASLTLQLGGLAPVSDAGKAWSFEPHAAGSGVSQVETGYTLATGAFSVEWTATTKGSSSSYGELFRAVVTTPEGTTGSISVPTFGIALASLQISINGVAVYAKDTVLSTTFGAVTATEHYVTFANASTQGGVYSIVAEQR
ncbi:hypothetical protein Gpo141_00003193 [Globisporangium polare]